MSMILNEHDIVESSQHGFTEGRSCLTTVLEFFEEVSARTYEGTPVDVIYLDFAKYFK